MTKINCYRLNDKEKNNILKKLLNSCTSKEACFRKRVLLTFHLHHNPQTSIKILPWQQNQASKKYLSASWVNWSFLSIMCLLCLQDKMAVNKKKSHNSHQLQKTLDSMIGRNPFTIFMMKQDKFYTTTINAENSVTKWFFYGCLMASHKSEPHANI